MRKVKYIEKSCQSSEKILFVPDIASVVYIPSVVFIVLSFVFPGFFLVAIWLFLKWYKTEYAITNKRAVCKTGILFTVTNELRLSKIESVAVKQGIIGWFFEYGTIVFSGTGGTKVEIPYVAAPKKVKQVIDEIIDAPDTYMPNEGSENKKEEDVSWETILKWIFGGLVCIFFITIATVPENSQPSGEVDPIVQAIREQEVKERLEARKKEEQEEKRKKEQEEKNIEGLYIVKADEWNHGAEKFMACDTSENWSKYWESIVGDSDVNYAPSLVLQGKCIEIDNLYMTDYNIKVGKVERGEVREVILEERGKKPQIYYTKLTIEHRKFHKNPGGEKEELRKQERIKKFAEKERGKIVKSEVAVYLCITSQEFDDYFFSLEDDTQRRKYERGNTCFKIKSQTPRKIVNIDENNWWIEYEILDGPHKGKKLWGFPHIS